MTDGFALSLHAVRIRAAALANMMDFLIAYFLSKWAGTS